MEIEDEEGREGRPQDMRTHAKSTHRWLGTDLRSTQTSVLLGKQVFFPWF